MFLCTMDTPSASRAYCFSWLIVLMLIDLLLVPTTLLMAFLALLFGSAAHHWLFLPAVVISLSGVGVAVFLTVIVARVLYGPERVRNWPRLCRRRWISSRDDAKGCESCTLTQPAKANLRVRCQDGHCWIAGFRSQRQGG